MFTRQYLDRVITVHFLIENLKLIGHRNVSVTKQIRKDLILNLILTLLAFGEQQRVLVRLLKYFQLSTSWTDELFIMPKFRVIIHDHWLMIWWQPSATHKLRVLVQIILPTRNTLLCCAYLGNSETQNKSLLIDEWKRVVPSCKICHRCLPGKNTTITSDLVE